MEVLKTIPELMYLVTPHHWSSRNGCLVIYSSEGKKVSHWGNVSYNYHQAIG